MLLFWTAAALLSAAAAALVMWRARGSDAAPAEFPELTVYRRHLAEQDELKERGLLGEAEWKASRAEAGRRLLATSGPEAVAPVMDSRKQATIVLGAVLASAALALGIYAVVGAPGAGDQPFERRMQAWRATARTDPGSLAPAEAAALLAEAAQKQPNNPDAWSFLGRARTAAGDYFGAVQALERAVALRPDGADDWTALGEALGGLAGGKPDPDAEKAFRRAMALDPRAPAPRYDLGRLQLMAGKREEGLALWREALALIPATDPQHAALQAEIATESANTGAGPAANPAAAAIAAADPTAQDAAIRGMVAGLAARLEAQPDDAEGWARLVRAYGVLGETDKQQRALARARVQFRDRPTELAAIEAAAR